MGSVPSGGVTGAYRTTRATWEARQAAPLAEITERLMDFRGEAITVHARRTAALGPARDSEERTLTSAPLSAKIRAAGAPEESKA